MWNLVCFGIVIAIALITGVAWIWRESLDSGDECTSTQTHYKVKNLKSKQISETSLELQWEPPDDTNDLIEKYTIKMTIISNSSRRSFETSKTQYRFDNVEPCSSYLFVVGIIGRKQDSKYLDQELLVSTEDVAPYAPTEFSIDMKTKLVRWTPNTKRVSCVHEWNLRLYHSNMCIKDVIVSRSVIHYQLTDVTTCSRYVATLQAVGKIPSSNSALIEKKTDFDLSDLQSIFLVQNLSYSIENRNQILLTWNSTESYHDCVYDYVVSIPNYVNLPWITTRETHLILSNLNACAKYRVTVTARNLYKEFVGRSTDILVQTNTLENHLRNVSFSETNGNLVVTWKLAESEIHCVEYYSLDICALDVNVPCRTYKPNEEVLNGEITAEIPDILPCATYKISISIVGAEKQYTFFSEIYKSKEKVFSPPILKKIEQITSRSVKLKWSGRNQNKNHCSLLSAILECTVDGNAFMSYEFSALSGPDIVTEVTNLNPYTNYKCYLSFNQLIGRSGKSSVIEFTTLEDVPSMINSLSVVQVSHNSTSVSWKPPTFINGILKWYLLQVKYNRALYSKSSWCSNEHRVPQKITLTSTDLNYEIKNLYPFEEYNISVTAASGAGYGELAELVIATAPAAPGEVYQPQCSSTSLLMYILTWKQPCRLNGILKQFKIIVIGTRDKHSDDRFSYSIMPNLSFPDAEYSIKLPKLRPVYKYQFQISAVVDKVSEFGTVSTVELSTPASLPPIPSSEQLVKVSPRSVYGRNGTRVEVTLTKDMFDDYGGDVLYYALIVGRDVSPNHKIESGFINIFQRWPEMGKWSEASAYDFVFPYQTTPPYWNPFQGNDPNESVTYIVGEDTFCETAFDGYCNGPLKPETKYSMKIRAYTAGGYQDSPPLKFTTGSEIETSKTNYLLGSCVFLFLVFVICGLFYVQKRHIPIFVEIRQRMNGRKRLNVLTTKTIPIKTFPEYYEKLQETPHILKIEFNELNEISAKYNMSDNVAKRYDNYKKNRYVNIVPYDETRVKINTKKGDYINASFIEGYKKENNRYIACQGPLATTCNDFWTMILQYDVSVIVMLCQVTENKKTVCEKYFPDVNQNLNFEDISVECTIMTSNSLFEERRIKVIKNDKELIVSHIKFLEWPDFGIPSDFEVLIDFCNAVRKRWTDKPVVVHCSAGVGRTGTFIACDILLQQLTKSKSVNIFNTVLQLRKQRPGMVQSITQYTYLYQCVYIGIKKLNQDRATN